ncbi:MAG TPA: hypothetical protein VL970_13940 [Candidatus Acidoferrales bacterium]|nr:hypothetical protein [Candidatus Acidoferrales bacterium]
MSMWPLEALGISNVMAAMANSGIVMFALRCEESLPVRIKRWSGSWQEHLTGRTKAVAAIFYDCGGYPHNAISADQELRARLKFSGVRYFSQVVMDTAALPSHGFQARANYDDQGNPQLATILSSSAPIDTQQRHRQ